MTKPHETSQPSTDQMLETALANFISFTIGIISAGFAIWYTEHRQRRLERQKETQRLLFEIYMKLLQIRADYFWINSADVGGTVRNPEARNRIWGLAYQLSDQLRLIDDVDEVDRILDALFNDSHCQNSAERYEVLSRLVDSLGEKVNPRYVAKMREISNANIRVGLARGPNAPSMLHMPAIPRVVSSLDGHDSEAP